MRQKSGCHASSMVYVLAFCSYVALGLSTLLKGGGHRSSIITRGNGGQLRTDDLHLSTGESRMVVYFPQDLTGMLTTLQELAVLCRLSHRPLQVLLLSTQPPKWLYGTLRNLIGGEHMLVGMRLASQDQAQRRLNGMLKRWNKTPLLIDLGCNRTQGEGMTARELDVVLGMLRGETMAVQRNRLGFSSNTLYSQRISGVRKLIGQFPYLISLLPRSQRPISSPVPAVYGIPRLSPQEYAFEQAIHQGLVFPVFQPITNARLRVKGFEILIRWMRGGVEQLPAAFLPEITASRTWLLLTAYVINEAVRQINRTNGAFYFSVNVPPGVVESGALIRMTETARSHLKDNTFIDRLVLEFSETTEVSRGRVMESIQKIKEAGHRILLDDCFSSGSVVFPVRQVQFSGYKLDMSIVNTFIHNPHDASLVKLLASYCNFNGTEYIAEGVDTREKFVALARAGVTGFQGYYISRPVYLEAIDDTVRLLESRSHDAIHEIGSGIREEK